MSLTIITPPASEPLTLADAKVHLRVDHDADDALIVAMIAAAREEAEQRTQRSLMPQTLELVMDRFQPHMPLPRPPVSAVVSIQYIDTNGVEQTLSPSNYIAALVGDDPRVTPAYGYSWPSTQPVPQAVRIRYTAGYANAAAVPAAVVCWMKLKIGDLYENRAGTNVGNIVSPLAFADSLLDRARAWSY
jgi:uncharacterized phiE125 gp8 family phage protein